MLRDRLQMVTNAIYFNAPLASNAPWVVVQGGANAWSGVYVYHLAPAENGDKHNIYVDLLDEQGRPLTASSLRLAHTWKDRRDWQPAPLTAFDKQPSEPLANLPIEKGQNMTIWLEDNGQCVSDKVSELHALMAGTGGGSDWHHHSYYVVFQRRAVVTPLPDKPAPDGRKQAIFRQIRDLLDEAEQIL